ncbi:hypothetical protein X925_06615 [Petrotoga sp. 9T1HF07.CasAA.8.2]|nr:hypothetical protein X925_06615 [Petrotoga sp. 9T1HF07.CasAA.8.2]
MGGGWEKQGVALSAGLGTAGPFFRRVGSGGRALIKILIPHGRAAGWRGAIESL